jgi:tetratricopeptide (TPR) repeat protein
MMIHSKYLSALLALALAVASAGCTKQLKASRHMGRGNKDFRAELYDRAEIEYLNVLKNEPRSPEAIRQLGLTYYAEGKLPQALEYLQEAVKQTPGNTEARLKLGLACMSLRLFKEAHAAAAEVVRKDPTSEEALALLAESAVGTNVVQETRRQLEALPASAKATAAYHVACGTLDVRGHKLDQAEAEFKQALVRDPKSSMAGLALGTLYLMRNDPKRAGPALKAAAQLAPLRSPARLRYAEFQLSNGAAQEAKQSVEEITRKAPDYIPAWLFLANTAFAERKTADCSALLKRLLERDPINYDALMLSGKLSMVEGQATNAITQFERVAAIYPGEHPELDYQLAVAHLMDKDPVKAISSLRRAIAAAPNYPDAVLLLANLNISQGDSASAIASLTRLIQTQPLWPQAQLSLARAYLAQKDLNAAVAVYRRMMVSFPTNYTVPFLMGVALAQENKTDEARQAFVRTLKLAPDYFPALEKLVDLDLLEKQYGRATDRVAKAIAAHPKAPDLWLISAKVHLAQAMGYVSKEPAGNAGPIPPNLAQVPAAQPDVKQAETALQKAIALNPDTRSAYLMLAQLYEDYGKHQQALDQLNGYLAKTNDVTALMLLGIIQDRSKNYAAARDAYQRLLQVSPNAVPALNNLACLDYTHLGQLDKGYQLAQRAYQLQPSDPAVADTFGWALFQKGQYDRCVGLFQDSAAKRPSDPEIQFHLGMAHYMLGDEGPARLALERAIQLGGKDFPEQGAASRGLALLAIDPKTATPAARASLEEWLQTHPKDPIALTRLGAIQVRAGAFAAAAQTYQTALDCMPENIQVMLDLARIYADHTKDLPQALQIMKHAHDRAPQDARVSHLLGRLVFHQGDFQWASSLLEQSATALPDDPEVAYDVAWSRYSLGHVAQAQAAMALASKAGPALPQAQDAQRFLSLTAAAKTPVLAGQASPQAQQILATEPDYVPALMVCALAQEQQGNYAPAAQFYDRILARYPDFAPASKNLAMLCFTRLGDQQRAYALATKAFQALPEDTDLAKLLGVLAYRRGDYARAATLLQQITLAQTTDAEVYYYLGMTNYHLNQSADAKSALQRALGLKLQPKLAQDARGVLAKLK